MRYLSIDSAFGSWLHIFIHSTDTTRQPRTPSATNENQVLRHPSRQPIKIEHGKNPSTSSVNQNRVLRNPSPQLIKIEHEKNPSTSSANQNRLLRNPSRHYVTRELLAPGRLFSALGLSRLAIANLNT